MDPTAGLSGLRFVKVNHAGCENRCDEVVSAITQMFDDLLSVSMA